MAFVMSEGGPTSRRVRCRRVARFAPDILHASRIGTTGTALLAGAGYKLQENVSDVGKFVGPASNAILVVLAAGYLWRLWTHRHQGQGQD